MLFDPRGFRARVVKGTGRTNYFVDWLEEKTKNGSLGFLFEVKDSKYVSDEISNHDVSLWTPEVPVVISAPTGSGKNSFIQTTLLKHALVRRAEGESDRILILSNRIALSRQNKHKFAERVVEYTGEYGCLERLDSLYTAEGSDKLCFNFGPVTVCSYHQLWEKQLFHRHHYKYVVCDECHFFTNDSTFNPNTDAILRYIVEECQSSIRIYMSATIDTVIDPIIREEYRMVEEMVHKVEDSCRAYYENPIRRFNAQQALVGYSVDSFCTSSVDSIVDQFRRENGLKIRYYHFLRHYDQVDHVYWFSYMNEAVSKILADKDRSHKWLFFVQDSKVGERVSADFNKNERKSTFLSRKRVDEMEDVKKAYDAIVANEHFKDDVLVTTSILDNGINIKSCPNGDRVVGVVIDSFKKDQFIQMLGRVRVGEDQKFNLYVRKMEVDELKEKMTRILDGLVRRLRVDQESIETKKRFYDKELFRFTSDEEGFFTYNRLAILQLCTTAIPILMCLDSRRATEGIHCSSIELDACKTRAIEYYKNGKGRYDQYADLILSVLQLEIPKPSCGLDSFEDYLHYRLIDGYFEKKTNTKIEQLKLLCPEAGEELEWQEVDLPQSLKRTPYEQLQDLVELLAKRGFHVQTKEEDHYDAISEHLFQLSLKNLGVDVTTVKLQEGWLGREYESSEKLETLKAKKE